VADSIPVDQIARERDAGWPTIHPEDYCHRCGGRNMLWFADSGTWLVATEAWAADTGREGIFCPQCFADLYEEATGERCVWSLSPQIRTAR